MFSYICFPGTETSLTNEGELKFTSLKGAEISKKKLNLNVAI